MSVVHPVFVIAATLIVFLLCSSLGRFHSGGLSIGRYRTIDGLRGYLAFFVFLHHASITYFFAISGKWGVPPSNLFTHLGQSSVALFFMITGFLFYGKVLDSHDGAIDWAKLFVSRLLRLAPLYLVTVMMLLGLVAIQSGGILVDSVPYTLRCVAYWASFTILGAPDINGVDASRFLAGVNWSLPYEWYFYLVLPLLALTKRIQVPWPYLLLSATGLAFAMMHHVSLFFTFMFAGGIVAAFAVRNQALTQFAKTGLGSLLALACLTVPVAFSSTAYDYPQFVLLTAAFTLIAAGADMFGVLSARPSHILGELSYSIYLLHGMLLFITTRYVIGYEEIRTMSAVAYWCSMFGLVPVLLILATLTFRTIEFPAMKSVPAVMARFRRIRNVRPRIPIHDPLAEIMDGDADGKAL